MSLSRFGRAPLFMLAAGLALAAFSLTFTHLAGSFGGPGFEDANGNSARFKSAAGVAVDSSGNVYVCDTLNHTIRKISTGGEVSTLAGLAETSGTATGRGAHARFNSPEGLTVDSSGNVYVADTANNAIRKITPAGVVTNFAGFPGLFGNVNATGTSARFTTPRGITIDGSNNLYVADTFNHTIRMITPGGAVTTIAGTGSAGNTNNTGTAASFNTPSGIVYDASSSSLFVADLGNNVVRKITVPGYVVTTFAGTMNTPGSVNGMPGRFYAPRGVTVDASGNVYVADTTDNSVRSITPGGTVATVAGFIAYPGPSDGNDITARFYQPYGVAAYSTNIYVADTGNNTLRKIALSGGTNVTTFAGLANASGYVDASGSAARFNNPSGITFYPGPVNLASMYVADTGNNAIRRVGLDGAVTTLAGGTFGYQEGMGSNAYFRSPKSVSINLGDLRVYVADTGNHCIRAIDMSGSTALYAGQATSSGNANGDRLTTASFNSPQAVVVNSNFTALYVADTGNYLVRKITFSSGQVTTLAGSGSPGSMNGNGTGASFGVLTGIWVDGSENVYVAESQQYTIRKITSSGDVTTFAGSCCAAAVDGTGTAARFGYPGPTSIAALYSGGTGYVADPNAHLIRGITTGAVVTTAGGKNGVNGTSDGTGTFARFNAAAQIGSPNTSYLAITEQQTIRYGSAEISDRATIDSAAGLVGNARQLDMSPQTATSWSWSIIRRPSGSTANLSATNIRNPTFTPDVPDLFVFRCAATSASGTSISTVSLQGNGAATSLQVPSVGYPGPQTAGVPFAVTVTALDADGNVADGYTGQVHWTSSDNGATLPANYTFLGSEHGVHTFSVTLVHAGVQFYTATDMSNGTITGTGGVVVVGGDGASLSLTLPTTANANVPITPTVTAYDIYNNVAAGYHGTIHFTSSDGSATLPVNRTFTSLDGGIVSFASGVTLRTIGSQSVTVTDTMNGSLTSTQPVTVGLAAPTSITATRLTNTSISVSWPSSTGADHYEIARASGAGYSPLTTTMGTGITDTVSANTTYAYKVRAVDANTNVSAYTTPDAATTMTFTDDPLVANTTLVKSIHLTQLRTAVNYFRAAAALGDATFTNSGNAGTPIRAIDITELRTALNAARTALGIPTLSFADSSISVTVTKVKASHVTELRNGVK